MIVEWTESALDRLADLYVAVDRQEQDRIESTVQTINRMLADDPSSLGESRSGSRRVWFQDPLMIIFRIDPKERLVVVSHVSWSRRK